MRRPGACRSTSGERRGGRRALSRHDRHAHDARRLGTARSGGARGGHRHGRCAGRGRGANGGRSWRRVLGSNETEARETALRLYRAGILAREGDDEPLPIGVVPRLIMPRELAHQVRRVQDEMAAGNLTQSPLRVLIELLDDAELEAAARIWGLRTVPGVANRRDLSSRLLRLINDPARVEQVTRPRSGRRGDLEDRARRSRHRCRSRQWPAGRDSPGTTRAPSPACAPRWRSSKARCSSGTPTAMASAGSSCRRRFARRERRRRKSCPRSSVRRSIRNCRGPGVIPTRWPGTC